MNLHALDRARADKLATLKPFADKLAAGQALNDEERAAFDATEAEIRALDGDRDRARLLAERQRTEPAKPLAGGEEARALTVFANTETRAAFKGETWRASDGRRIPVLSAEHRMADLLQDGGGEASELGLGGFLRALTQGPRNELERRVLGGAAVGTGGAIVPAPLAAELIDRMRQSAVAIQAGARTVPMTSASLRMARQTTDPTGGWRAENAAIAESDPVFDQVTLAAKAWAVRFNVSRELLEDGVNADAACRNILARAAAVALDQAILTGAGGANEPLGIRGQSGIQSVSMGTNGAALTGWAPVLNAVQALEAANAGTISAMIAAPRTARTIYGFADTTGQPLQPPPRIASVPLLVSSGVPINETQGTATNASSVFLGDFAEVMIGLRTDLQISVLDQRFADVGQVGFLAWMRADVALARPGALARIAGITP